MEFPKKKRKQNQDLIDYLGDRLECACCAQQAPNDMDHLVTKGSGGHDEFNNLVPLCRNCHTLRHKNGISYLIEKFPSYKSYLRMLGQSELITRVMDRKPK